MPGRTAALAWLTFWLAMASLAGCTSDASDRPAERPSDRVVYVAIGASDTTGVGTDDPSRQAWPSVFRRLALPPHAEYHNLGIPGATTELAIRAELPRAIALRPTVATVWLNVNDLTSGVSPDTYEDRLRRLLTSLREAGTAEILVANTPMLDELPAYRACLPSVASRFDCAFDGFAPRPELVRRAVDAYNEAIARAARAAGATVVDLHAVGPVPVEHPGWVSEDGFHPSAAGHRVVAERFAAALGAPPG